MDERSPQRDGDYLWDRSTPVDPLVAQLEQTLGALAYDPKRRPLVLPARRLPRWPFALAAAAALLVALGAGTFYWRLRWPASQAWTMTSDTASGRRTGALEVGRRIDVREGDAFVGVARLGSMRIETGTSVQLQATSTTRHVLAVDRGAIEVRVWAPPGRLLIRTPTGSVIDLGCAFRLVVDADTSSVHVRSGWVQLDNGIDEVLIPEGAMSFMTSRTRPGVPVYEDASPAFIAAVRALESATGDRGSSIRVVIEHARPRDVLTLLMLIERGLPEAGLLAGRAAELVPPPPSVSVDAVARGNRTALWAWYERLALPSPKSWMKNWRDGFPPWLLRLGR